MPILIQFKDRSTIVVGSDMKNMMKKLEGSGIDYLELTDADKKTPLLLIDSVDSTILLISEISPENYRIMKERRDQEKKAREQMQSQNKGGMIDIPMPVRKIIKPS